MANIVDATQDLTIALLQEGFATIVNFTVDKASAYPGDPITFGYQLRNDGDATDVIFARIVDIDTGLAVMPMDFFSLAPGAVTPNKQYAFTMPNTILNVRLEAGHQE